LELLFNFAWLTVAMALWGLWLIRRHNGRQQSLLRTMAAEAITLVVLTAVLLPAVSITDDLHACQLPTEIRRCEVQGDRHLVPISPPNHLHFALALLTVWKNLPDSRSSRLLAVDQLPPPAVYRDFRPLSSRPPPARP
jgi:hypothetical protein